MALSQVSHNDKANIKFVLVAREHLYPLQKQNKADFSVDSISDIRLWRDSLVKYSLPLSIN